MRLRLRIRANREAAGPFDRGMHRLLAWAALSLFCAACSATRGGEMDGAPVVASKTPAALRVSLSPPLSNASLWCWDSRHGVLAHWCEFENGRAVVDRRWLGWVDRLVVSAPGHVSTAVLVDPLAYSESVLIELPREPVTAGRVVFEGDAQPRGLRGAVRRVHGEADRDHGWIWSYARGVTVPVAQDGTFVVRGIPAGEFVGLQRGDGSAVVTVEGGVRDHELQMRAAGAPRKDVVGTVESAVVIPGESRRRLRACCVLHWDDPGSRPSSVGSLAIDEDVAVGGAFAIDLGRYRGSAGADRMSVTILASDPERHAVLAGPFEIDPNALPVDLGRVLVGERDRAQRVRVVCGGRPAAGVSIDTDGTTSYRTDADGWATVRIGPAVTHATVWGHGIRGARLPVHGGAEPWWISRPAAARVEVRVVGVNGAPLSRDNVARYSVRVTGVLHEPDGPFYACMLMAPRALCTVARRSISTDRSFEMVCVLPPDGRFELEDVWGPVEFELLTETQDGSKSAVCARSVSIHGDSSRYLELRAETP